MLELVEEGGLWATIRSYAQDIINYSYYSLSELTMVASTSLVVVRVCVCLTMIATTSLPVILAGSGRLLLSNDPLVIVINVLVIGVIFCQCFSFD